MKSETGTKVSMALTVTVRRSDFLTAACIADSQHNPAYVRAMMGAACTQTQRHEGYAIYLQAQRSLYMGDLGYFSDEHAGVRTSDPLRAAGRPRALLTGSHDCTTPSDNTRALCCAIGADKVWFREMQGLGHFPMIEVSTAFRPHFLATLQQMEGIPP